LFRHPAAPTAAPAAPSGLLPLASPPAPQRSPPAPPHKPRWRALYPSIGAAQTPLSKSLRTLFLYNTWIGRLLMQLPPTWWLLTWEHKRIAAFANSPRSKSKISSFIKARRWGWRGTARAIPSVGGGGARGEGVFVGRLTQ
jgi:hypothetical protein